MLLERGVLFCSDPAEPIVPMSRKIIDHKKQGRQPARREEEHAIQYEPEILAPTEHLPLKSSGGFSKISIGEFLTAISLLYVCTIASFNAGYFSGVHGNFVEFFSIADLAGANIPVLQYFVGVLGLYCLVSVYFSILSTFTGANISAAFHEIAENFFVKHHANAHMFWGVYILLLIFFYAATALFKHFNISNFTLVMIPDLIFQSFLILFFWMGYKNEYLPARTLAVATLLGLFVTSNNAGAAWLRSELAVPNNVQAIIDKDGGCLERNILRNSSSGLLLYNPTMKQFEFRNKDGFKTIYEGRGCT
ncbi:hypothetical protein [uncultured Bradyrhizobium sp.]|uniref:hypothetical protein n=1 Tax=uncultured Bradyrhizobium sp. TaxID=199684 RepID=UPI0035C9B9E2